MTKIQRLSWIIRAGLIYSHEPSRQNRRWSEKFESRGLHMSPMVGRWRGPRGKETIALVLKITRNYVLLTTWRNVKVGSSPASPGQNPAQVTHLDFSLSHAHAGSGLLPHQTVEIRERLSHSVGGNLLWYQQKMNTLSISPARWNFRWSGANYGRPLS